MPFGNSGVLQNLPLWISKSPAPVNTKSSIKNPSSNPVGLLDKLLTSRLYDVSIILRGEFILSGSEYPKGP